MKKKLIMCDLDGTLLNNKGELSEVTIKTVKKLTKMGHHFCIATGRPKRGSHYLYKQLGLKTIMCNFNGSYINNPADKSFMPMNFTFSRHLVKEILENKLILERIENAVVETAKGTYMLHKPLSGEDEINLLQQFHITYGKNNVSFIKSYEDIKMDPNSILLLLKSRESVRQIREEVRKVSKLMVLRE